MHAIHTAWIICTFMHGLEDLTAFAKVYTICGIKRLLNVQIQILMIYKCTFAECCQHIKKYYSLYKLMKRKYELRL